jgi:hypothetical protein
MRAFSFLFILFSYVLTKPCDPSDTTYKGKQVELVNQSSRSISGTLRVLDGCSFMIYNFRLSPPAISTFFYGSMSLKDTKVYRINMDPLGAYAGVDSKFNLTGEFGSSGTKDQMYSWSEFKVIKIISNSENSVLAYAVLEEDPKLEVKSDAPVFSLLSWLEWFAFGLLTLIWNL